MPLYLPSVTASTEPDTLRKSLTRGRSRSKMCTVKTSLRMRPGYSHSGWGSIDESALAFDDKRNEKNLVALGTSINQSTNPVVNKLLINQSINQSYGGQTSDQSINQSTYRKPIFDQSINQSSENSPLRTRPARQTYSTWCPPPSRPGPESSTNHQTPSGSLWYAPPRGPSWNSATNAAVDAPRRTGVLTCAATARGHT